MKVKSWFSQTSFRQRIWLFVTIAVMAVILLFGILLDSPDQITESIEFNVSLGYGTVEKTRAKAGIYFNNIFGTARKFGITPRISFVYRGIEASFTEPWTFGTRWRTDVNAWIDHVEEPGYDLLRRGGRVTLGRNLGRFTSVSLAYRNAREIS